MLLAAKGGVTDSEDSDGLNDKRSDACLGNQSRKTLQASQATPPGFQVTLTMIHVQKGDREIKVVKDGQMVATGGQEPGFPLSLLRALAPGACILEVTTHSKLEPSLLAKSTPPGMEPSLREASPGWIPPSGSSLGPGTRASSRGVLSSRPCPCSRSLRGHQ